MTPAMGGLVAQSIRRNRQDFVFASVGNGFGMIFDMCGEPDFGMIYEIEVFGPLLGLAALSCLPILYKRYKARRGG